MIPIQRLQLRRVAQDEALAKQFLQRKPYLDYRLDNAIGQLQLRLARDNRGRFANPSGFLTQSGPVLIYNAEPLLCLLSSCPALLENAQCDTSSWYWDVYNYYLSPELKGLFGYLQPVTQSMPVTLYCGIDIFLNGRHSNGMIALTPTTLLQLIQHAQWLLPFSAKKYPLPLSIPLLLASAALSIDEIRSLRLGDIVLMQVHYFNPQGVGKIGIGNRYFGLRQHVATNLTFYITHTLEDGMQSSQQHDAETRIPTEMTLNTQSVGADRPMASTPTANPPSFSQITLHVTLRAGTLKMTLEQIQSLDVGSILTFSNCTPGHAALYYEERPLAHGELVDVDGTLGLQITRLESF